MQEKVMEMEIGLDKIIEAVGGEGIPGADQLSVTSVVIDSRKAVPGSLFVAFAGENTDGHDYLTDCARRGAVAALVEREVPPPEGLAVIKVPCTQLALQEIAAWQRRRFPSLKVLGVTGSSGKTTTKEFIAGVIAQKYTVLKNKGNLNNEIGLPLTVFDIEPEHQWAVLEMGMSSLGEIRQLCKISLPSLGVITNIGEAHIERLGSREAIVQAKFELAENLVPPGAIVLNGDDLLLRQRAAQGLPGVDKVIFYGLEEGNDVRAVNVETDIQGSSFDLQWNGGRMRITLGLPGRHNVSNALAAFAVGLLLEIPPEHIAAGLAGTRGEKRRLQQFAVSGYTVIDDSYNANPDSVVRALEVLSSYPPGQRRVAILGDMLELGEIASEKHRLIGAAAVTNGVELLIAVGAFAGDVRQGAVEAGLAEKAVHTLPSSQAAAEAAALLQPGDIVLVKGSLGAKMDVIVHKLLSGGNESC